jgi:hypothetical protein
MKTREKGLFNIVRFYSNNSKPRIIEKRLNWTEAEKWVNDPSTSKPGKWFDGFVQIK